jgi:D-amino-acid dehydrogenase
MPRLLPYFLRLVRNSTPQRVDELSQAIANLVVPGIESYRRLLDDSDAPTRLIRQNGCLYLYETKAIMDAAEDDNAYRRRRGIDIQTLGPDETKQMLPALGVPVAGSVLATASGHTINPLGLSQALAELIRDDGGRFIRARVTGFKTNSDTVTHVETDAGRQAVGGVVVAAGAFSRPLAKRLGSDVPLETERGYHVMLPKSGIDLRLPILVGGHGFAVTPMEHGLRVAGTVEFAGLKAPPNYARADVLLRHARRLFPDLNDSGMERWMGHRPSLPDSLPVISTSPNFRNASFAFGHGHLGLSLGAVTGRMIADLVAGRPPIVAPSPYRINRFH